MAKQRLWGWVERKRVRGRRDARAARGGRGRKQEGAAEKAIDAPSGPYGGA